MKKPINANRLGKTFETLVSIDSVSKEEGRISQEIQRLIAPLASKIIIDRAGEKTGGDTGNLIVRIDGNRNLRPLMLNAHMDTVEPGRGVKIRYADGVFTSDGTTILGADDKSAIAILLEALWMIKENNLPHGPLELVFTVCEEIGLLGARHLDYDLISSAYGYALDTSDTETIVVQAPALNRIDILLHGRDAHAGVDPEKGINAILLASRAIAGLELGRVDEETTCNIGVMEAAGATNIVPKRVRVAGEARSHNEEKLERVTRNIVSAFEQVVDEHRRRHAADDLPRLEATVTNAFGRTFIPANHPVVLTAQRAAANLGRTLATRSTGGGSDANIFFGKKIITAVIGTGMQEMHTLRESIRMSDMVDTLRLLLGIIDLHAGGAFEP